MQGACNYNYMYNENESVFEYLLFAAYYYEKFKSNLVSIVAI